MAKELIYKVRIDYDASSAVSGADRIEDSQEEARFSIKRTEEAFDDLFAATKRTQSRTRSFSRAQSSANQVLFSYGDLLNDAQQFQFGFSNGLRAIGNNIGFAAEGIANLNTRAGGFRGTLKALGASLLGPGGLILGINLVVTAFTVFGDKLFDTGKAAEKLNEDLKTTSDFFEQIAKTRVEEFVSQTENVDKQINAISEALNNLFLEDAGLQNLPVPMQQLNSAAADATNTFQQGLSPQINATNQALDRTELLNSKVREETRQILINKKAELEAQKLVNEALRDALAAEQQIEGITGTAEISLQTIGGDAISPEQQRQIEARREEAEKTQAILDDIATKTVPQAIQSIDQVALQGVDAVEEKIRFTRDAIFSATEAAGMAIRALFGESKAAAIADAIVQGALAVQRALASAPPPFNFAIAATVAAATAAQIAKIKNTEIGSSSSGGGGTANIGASENTSGDLTRSTNNRRISGIQERNNERQPIIIQGDINTVATAFKVRQGEAEIRKVQQ